MTGLFDRLALILSFVVDTHRPGLFVTCNSHIDLRCDAVQLPYIASDGGEPIAGEGEH
eukprot:COSAG02_NODE_57736_length_279_cov_1.294444_1_plen_57_part_01